MFLSLQNNNITWSPVILIKCQNNNNNINKSMFKWQNAVTNIYITSDSVIMNDKYDNQAWPLLGCANGRKFRLTQKNRLYLIESKTLDLQRPSNYQTLDLQRPSNYHYHHKYSVGAAISFRLYASSIMWNPPYMRHSFISSPKIELCIWSVRTTSKCSSQSTCSGNVVDLYLAVSVGIVSI
jgi:hypothetical protein